MIYKLEFNKRALREWKKLDSTVRQQFKKKLKERLKQPVVQSAKIYGIDNCYKIKLKAFGYRLVYTVIDDRLVVLVLAVGKRGRNAAYKAALKRN